MFSEVWDIYLRTRKDVEHPWTKYASRPFGALFVYVLRRTPITPNQVTIIAILVAAVACALVAFWPGYVGLMVGLVVFQLAYILDCVDGQLARIKGVASKAGHLFDFLMDEAKAKMFFAAVAARLYLEASNDLYLWAGLGGLLLMSVSLSLTTFIRRPEMNPGASDTDKAADAAPKAKSFVSKVVGFGLRGAQHLMNYPTYIFFLGLFEVIEVYFWLIQAMYLLYLAKTFLQIVWRLGRFNSTL